MPHRRPVIDRLLDKVARDEHVECWLFTGTLNKKGYGQINSGGKTGRPLAAHRVSYEHFVGPIPVGMMVDHRHSCPKNCVNPDHLRPATPEQNVQNHSGPTGVSTTGVRGVYRKGNRFWGRVQHRRTNYHAGTFATLAEAEAATVALRCQLHEYNDKDRADSAA